MKLYSSWVGKMPIPTLPTSAAQPKDCAKSVEDKAQPTHFPVKEAVDRTGLVSCDSLEDSKKREIRF